MYKTGLNFSWSREMGIFSTCDLFGLEEHAVAKLGDGLQCATAYCRYLPISDKAQLACMSLGWVYPAMFPPIRLDSFIVPRGEALIEYDLCWLKKKIILLEREFKLRTQYRKIFGPTKASLEWIEEVDLPRRIAMSTANALRIELWKGKPVNKPWRNNSEKDEWARIEKNGGLPFPGEGYSMRLFDEIPFSTALDRHDRNMLHDLNRDDYLLDTHECAKEMAQHTRVLNVPLHHFGQAARGLRVRPFHHIRGLASPEAYHLAKFLTSRLKKQRQEIADHERSRKEIKEKEKNKEK